MSAYEDSKRRFTEIYSGTRSFWRNTRKLFSTPIKFISWYMPMWVGLMLFVESLLITDLLSSIFVHNKALWVPLRVHGLVILIILFGAMRKERLNRLKAKLGLDPPDLRTGEIFRSNAPKNNTLVRVMAIAALSAGISTANVWYMHLSPFNDIELGVNLYLDPLASFIDLWTRVMAVGYIQAVWLDMFGFTALLLLVLHFTPFTRWLIQRTLVVHAIAAITWLLLTISMGFWWDHIYDIGLL